MNDRIIMQGVFANPFVGIEVSDTNGRITATNPFFRNLLGYEESDLAGMTAEDLCHCADRERERGQRRQLSAGDIGQLTFRKRYLAKSGKTIWGDTSITAIHGAEGTCEALVATMVDVTAQRRHELLQQGQTRVLDLLYRNQPLPEVCAAIVETIEVVEEGLLCSILQLNAASGTLHKVAAPSLPDFYNAAIDGMKIGDGVGSCGAAAFHGQRVVVADILNHPNWARARRLVEKTNLRSCWSQPILANDGKVLGTFAIYYTKPREPGPFELELINAAAELTALAINHMQALTMLRKKDQLKSEFISTAAHELRTPLSSIMGYAELLRQTQELGISQPGKHEEFISVIVEKSEMLSRLVGDLLDVSKIENGAPLGLQKKPAPIRKTIADVVDHYQRNAPQHVFSLRTDSELPETAIVDEVRIVQVLDNLLSNAVKYSPHGGLIELEATAEPGKLRFSVSDQGIGMNEAERAQIFDKFYRANRGSSTEPGLGLGMSIARDIVEAHGGEIEVKSTPGQGTRVNFSVAYS